MKVVDVVPKDIHVLIDLNFSEVQGILDVMDSIEINLPKDKQTVFMNFFKMLKALEEDIIERKTDGS